MMQGDQKKKKIPLFDPRFGYSTGKCLSDGNAGGKFGWFVWKRVKSSLLYNRRPIQIEE
jgi:hypothetical protein